MGVVSRMTATVGRVFRKHPLLVNSAVYGTFYVAAEFSQQKLNQKYSPHHPPVDYAALPRFAFVGSCVYSPMLYVWYGKILDRYFIGTAMSTVVKKLLLDQLCMTPLLLVAFYTTMSLLEGREELFGELRAKFVQSFVANQVFWAPAQTLNFLFVPPALRVLYVATASFVWINVLCWIKRQTPEDEKKLSN